MAVTDICENCVHREVCKYKERVNALLTDSDNNWHPVCKYSMPQITNGNDPKEHEHQREDEQFEEFMVARNDEIDNAAYLLLDILANKLPLDWNIEMIQDLVDRAKDILGEHGIETCDPEWCGSAVLYVDNEPFDEFRVPCYRADYCGNHSCPMLKPEQPNRN